MIYFAWACIIFFLVLCTGAVVEFIRDKVKKPVEKEKEKSFVVEEEPEQMTCAEKRRRNQGKGWAKPAYKEAKRG